LVTAVREIWYRLAYTARPLSLLTPTVVPPLETATVTQASIRWIPSVKIAGVCRQALQVHAPSRVSFRCAVPRRGRFQTFVGFFPENPGSCPRGVEFAVEIAGTKSSSAIVYRKKVVVEHKSQNESWQRINLSIRRLREQDVDLTLAASLSANCPDDHFWALWAEPILLDCKPVKEMWADIKNFFAAFGPLGFAIEGIKLMSAQVINDRASPAGFHSRGRYLIANNTRNNLDSTKDFGRSQLSLSSGRKFAVYVNSRGNYFFREIGQLLVAGFHEIGCQVDLRTEKDGFDTDVWFHVVVAPHEFFYLGRGIELQSRGLPNNLILLNTEQPSTQWFSKAYRLFPSGQAVWEMNHSTCELLSSKGFSCFYLAPGFVRGFEPFQEVKELPMNGATTSLPNEILHQPYLDAPIAKRPIDILFIGYRSARRNNFFTEAASVLSKYRCYLHFSEATAPLITGGNTYMNTATAIGLAQRSKIVLNIHHGDDKYFEWHRIVMHGLWQKALVVSESADDAPPFEPGRDFVAASLQEIPHKLTFYLSSREGRDQAQAIANFGYRTLTEKVRLADRLRQALAQLSIETPGK